MSDAEVAARFEALQRKLVPLWTSIQTITQDPQTIVVVPSITHRLHDPRRPAAGLRRAVPVSAAAAPPAARAADLRHVAGHPRRRRRLLPGPAAGRAGQPREEAPVPGVAARRLVAAADAEAAGAAAADSADPRADSRPGPRAPGAVQHDAARARPGAGARHPDVRRRPEAHVRWAARAARGGSSPKRACRIRWASKTCTRPPTWPRRSSSMRARKPSIGKVVVKLNEGVSGRRQRASRSRRPARDRARASMRSPNACSALRFESSEMSFDTLLRQARRARRHRRGAHRRAATSAAPARSCA